MNIISQKSCISNKKAPIRGYNCKTVLEYRSILPFFPCLQSKTVRKGKRKFSCRHRIAGVYPHREIRTYRQGGELLRLQVNSCMSCRTHVLYEGFTRKKKLMKTIRPLE